MKGDDLQLIAEKVNRKQKADYPAVVLILSNLIVITLAVKENWPLAPLLWIYWWQSMIIGGFNFLRILSLRDFYSVYDDADQNRRNQVKQRNRVYSAFFFLLHYGFFHLIYWLFIIIKFGRPTAQREIIWLSIVIFLINHLYTFIYYYRHDRNTQPNLSLVMFFPYLRIMPMHITLMLAFFISGSNSLILFLILKTGADWGMHRIERRQVLRLTRA